MNKKIFIIFFIIFFTLFLKSGYISARQKSHSMAGKIFLQVENRGEAWYIHPKTLTRYYLKNGKEDYEIMRKKSLGISNNDLEKIPISSNQKGDTQLTQRLLGYILLQVEGHGEAWYVNPLDGLRYYLRDGD